MAHESLVDWHFESGGRCTTCTGSPYFHWDFYYVPHHGAAAHKGEVYQGTATAFNECMIVRIGGVDVNAASYSMHADNRGFDTADYASGNTHVIREVFVPEDGFDFTRWVDNFRNSGGAEANVTVQYYCVYYGCQAAGYYFDGGLGGVDGAGDDCTVGSSDGDENTEETDLWFAWNDGDTDGRPAVAIVTHGDGADEEPTAITFDGWTAFTIDFRLTIPAGDTQRLLLFLVQAEDNDTAMATADYLTGLPPEATEGLADPLPLFMNFITDGRPAVSPGGPYSVAEGGDIVLEPRIFDREGDAVIYAWDLDNDGTFEEDSLNPTFSAAGMDGPAPDPVVVALHVEEDFAGGHVVDKTAEIEIVNVAPIIISEPITAARRGGLYAYTPTVVDPGTPSGTEPMSYELVEDGFPEGMTVDPVTGLVSWVPRADQLGDHDVELFMEDDDGGEFTQEWSVTVTDNTAPYEPMPLYPTNTDCVRVLNPTFKVSNSSDLDEDPLFYFFEVDSDAGFRSIDLQRSGDVGIPEGNSGFTEWRVPRSLVDGETYYWRTWVTDGIEESEKRVDVFEVCADGSDGGDADTDIDADADGGGETADSAGCACRTTEAPGSLAFAMLGLAALAVTRRRKT